MATEGLYDIWVYLSASPLLGLTITLVAYLACDRVYTVCGCPAILNPVLTAILVLIGLLVLTRTRYETYFEGAQFVHFLLGPATVALAVPLYRQLGKLRTLWPAVVLSVCFGGAVAALSAVGVASLFGGSRETLLSLAPKSVTAPVGMGIAEKIGGLPSLTAVLVVATGILGAVFGTKLFDLLRIESDSVRGIAMGVTSHGIGTARAFQVSQEMGAFSGLAMALSALVTAFALPWLLQLLGLVV